VSFAVITLRVASQRVFIFVSFYFVIDSVRKLLATSSYSCQQSDPGRSTRRQSLGVVGLNDIDDEYKLQGSTFEMLMTFKDRWDYIRINFT
jgi:hypothetical protein